MIHLSYLLLIFLGNSLHWKNIYIGNCIDGKIALIENLLALKKIILKYLY
jgi:hypothetical protein